MGPSNTAHARIFSWILEYAVDTGDDVLSKAVTVDATSMHATSSLSDVSMIVITFVRSFSESVNSFVKDQPNALASSCIFVLKSLFPEDDAVELTKLENGFFVVYVFHTHTHTHTPHTHF